MNIPKSKMYSQFLNIKPNPNYVPGGVQNFWLTASTPEKKEGEKAGFASSSETEETRRKAGAKTASQHPESVGSGGLARSLFT